MTDQPAERLNKKEERSTSVLTRDVRGGQLVYVKKYLPGDGGRTEQIVQQRTAREASLVARLGKLRTMGGRLGVVQVVECDSKNATLVISEAEGYPLASLLANPRRSQARSCLRAVYLAGHWLRSFQFLPVSDDDQSRLTRDPEDLVEYCRVRFQRLVCLGECRLNSSETRILKVVSTCLDSTGAQVRVWSHQDYGPANIIWDGRKLTPIDFAMARQDHPLADVTYFIHRLEMLTWQFPWRRLSVQRWRKMFLRGYGARNVQDAPMFRAMMIRHLLCRLVTLTGRPAQTQIERVHDTWLARRVTARLMTYCD